MYVHVYRNVRGMCVWWDSLWQREYLLEEMSGITQKSQCSRPPPYIDQDAYGDTCSQLKKDRQTTSSFVVDALRARNVWAVWMHHSLDAFQRKKFRCKQAWYVFRLAPDAVAIWSGSSGQTGC